MNAVIDNLDAYEARTAVIAVEKFIDDLSNWYVRRSRERFWREGMDDDKQAAYATLYEVLTTLVKLIAGRLAPFSGNVIPANRIDPVARAVSRFFPAPNAPGNLVTGVNNYGR
ncbi:MAG: class I tRNA ligase family protein, partial [Anaerolineae bacterium]|nr:class I tRNA ligase family protein [Anaerolineae bacterium]